MSILMAPAPGSTITPPRKKPKWSVDEFHRIRATGIWDGLRTHLIRGEIWEQGGIRRTRVIQVQQVHSSPCLVDLSVNPFTNYLQGIYWLCGWESCVRGSLALTHSAAFSITRQSRDLPRLFAFQPTHPTIGTTRYR